MDSTWFLKVIFDLLSQYHIGIMNSIKDIITTNFAV